MESLAPPNSRPPPRFAGAVIHSIIVLVVMGRLLTYDFTWWDDPHTLHGNPLMTDVHLDSFTHYWAHADFDIYMPLTYNVWAIVASAAQVALNSQHITLNPQFFHALNLLTHLAGSLGAIALLRQLVKSDIAALIGALFWAIHPIQVESVGWLSGYKDVLSGTMVIWSIERFVAWRQSPSSLSPSRGRYAAWLVFLLLGLLAKPSAMTTPLVLLAIDRLALRSTWRASATALWPSLIVVAPFMVIAKIVQPAVTTISPLWARPLIALDSLAFYLTKLFVPIQFGIDYGRSPEAIIASHAIAYTWPLPAAIAVAVAWIYSHRVRHGEAIDLLPLAGMLVFVLAPVHVLGLTRFDFQRFSTVTDHYAYVAVLGPAMVLAWAVSRSPRGVLIVAGIGLVALAVRTFALTAVWADEGSLMQNALAVNPKSVVAYVNLAGDYSRAGRPDLELQNLQTAELLAPNEPLIFANYASHYMVVHDLPAADAAFQKTIALQLAARASEIEIVNAITKPIDVYIAMHRIDDADRYLQIGLAHFPKNESLMKRQLQLRAIHSDPNFVKVPSAVMPPLPLATPPATSASPS